MNVSLTKKPKNRKKIILNVKNKQYCTYIIINKIDGRIYVGYTGSFFKRANQHFNKKYRDLQLKQYKSHLYLAMNKNNIEDFYMNSVNFYSSKEEAATGEEELIIFYKNIGINLYNLNNGGLYTILDYVYVNEYNTDSEKHCSDCGEIKPNKEFAKNKTTYWGYDSICKKCKNARSRIKRNGNSEFIIKGCSFNDENNKYCTKCNQVKLRTEFYKNKYNSDNLSGYCKKCDSLIKNSNPKTDRVNLGFKLNTNDEKYCPRCKQMKAKITENFFFDKKQNKFVGMCKPCKKIYNRKRNNYE